MPRPIINFYAPPDVTSPKSPTTLAPVLDQKYLYVTYENPADNTRTSANFYLSPQPTCIPSYQRDLSSSPVLSQRRGAIDYGSSTRSLLSPAHLHKESILRARVLPQRILNPPRSENMVRSIWFKSRNGDDRNTTGVAMVEILGDSVQECLAGPSDEVFNDFTVPNNQVKFNILWPGYGHISWIARIPTVFHDEKGKPVGNITRVKLATAVAQHFQAFMTYHSMLRFAHPDPSWRIGRDDEGGIRFEQLRLIRLFCCDEGRRGHNDRLDGTSDGGCWQAEVLVADIVMV